MPAQPLFSLDDVARASFRTSAAADELNSRFQSGERLQLSGRNVAARLALARSLAVEDPPGDVPDVGGAVIKGVNLFGDESGLRTWITLLVEHAAHPLTLEELQDSVRRHWARGIALLDAEWEACGGDHDAFLLDLAERAGLPDDDGPRRRQPKSVGLVHHGAGFEPKAMPVRLPFGQVSVDATTSEPVTFAVNAKGGTPHLALMGTLGTGKTVVARSMLEAAHRQSGAPVLFFDMGKGDVAGNREFVAAIGATVVEPPRAPIPVDVLWCPKDEDAVNTAALRFRESIARVPQESRLGSQQCQLVTEAAARALKGPHPVKLGVVHDRLREIYAERKRKDDGVTGLFSDVARFKLFEPTMSPDEFFSRSWVFDLHKLPEFAQRLAVFLILDAAREFLALKEDTPIDADGNRALRLVLAIDEARRVLAYEHDSLIELIRTSRSKGGAVMMISQSPDDFDGDQENFLENVVGFCLRTNAKPSSLKAMFGEAVDLAGLPNGVGVARLPGEPRPRRVSIW
jgi:DNA sulfur modification protein DndE